MTRDTIAGCCEVIKCLCLWTFVGVSDGGFKQRSALIEPRRMAEGRGAKFWDVKGSRRDAIRSSVHLKINLFQGICRLVIIRRQVHF